MELKSWFSGLGREGGKVLTDHFVEFNKVVFYRCIWLVPIACGQHLPNFSNRIDEEAFTPNLGYCRLMPAEIGWGMLFDRQRVLLELLDALNEPVGSTDFQKLLFLYS